MCNQAQQQKGPFQQWLKKVSVNSHKERTDKFGRKETYNFCSLFYLVFEGKFSLRKHPFLLALRRWVRFARNRPQRRRAWRNGCFRRLGQIPSTSSLGGLYSEGRFNGGFFASRFWGAYTWRGLFSEIYGKSLRIYINPPKVSPLKRAFEKYNPWGLFSEFYGNLFSLFVTRSVQTTFLSCLF